MTGYARMEAREEWGQAVWEVRSVNHRYLEVSLRLPEELRALENAVRERVARQLKRGKVDCSLRFQGQGAAITKININQEFAKEIISAAKTLEKLMENPGRTSAWDLLRWPGVLDVAPPDVESLSTPILALLDSAVTALAADRAREGQRIQEFIAARCGEARANAQLLTDRAPLVIENYRQRLLDRVRNLGTDIDEGRLEQEMLLVAQRLDIAEELHRLSTHIDEVHTALQDQQAVGRRLDFLMQELNREANTLASKSLDAESTAACVNLKVLIEQMREQVQNIE